MLDLLWKPIDNHAIYASESQSDVIFLYVTDIKYLSKATILSNVNNNNNNNNNNN